MGLFSKFPYTDLNSINLDYTLNKLNDLYERGEALYTQLQTWQAETTEDLASWKSDVEAGLASWKTATEASIDNKIQLLTAAINAAFSDLETQLEAHISEIETTAVNAASAALASATAAAGSASEAADSATAAAGSASDTENTAESLSESLDQIATNASDITDLKSAITEIDTVLPSATVVNTLISGTSVEWETGYYYAAPIGSTITKTEYSTLACYVYGPVDRGDKFIVNARRAGDGYAIYVADENGIVLEKFAIEGNYYDNAPYTIQNSGIMYLNTYTSAYITGNNPLYRLKQEVTTLTDITSVPADISDLQTEVSSLDDTVDDISDIIPQKTVNITRIQGGDNTAWEDGYFYSGSIGGAITKTAYAQLSCYVYGAVKKDDVFYVTARRAGEGYAIYLVGSDNKISDKLTSETNYYDNVKYVVPSDGTMYLNCYTTAYLTPNGLYRLTQDIKVYKSLDSVLSGIKWATIGDSLSEFNRTANRNWIQDTIDNTNVINTNLAASGSGFYRGSPLDGQTTSYYLSRISLIPEDTELITVAGSFNDLSTSPWDTLPVGTASDTGDTTIAGYMNAFFDALLTAFPTTPIGVYMTSPWQNYKPGVTNADDYVSVLETICKTRGIPFSRECYDGCNLKPWISANRTEYYTHPDSTVDGVHPNDKGHVFIYRMLLPFLEKICYSTN